MCVWEREGESGRERNACVGSEVQTEGETAMASTRIKRCGVGSEVQTAGETATTSTRMRWSGVERSGI